MKSINRFTKTALAVAISQFIAVNTSQAASIQVTSELDDGTDCTLREAIVTFGEAADQSNGCTYTGVFGIDDTISFAPSLSGQTITLDSGFLYPKRYGSALTINGPGADLLEINGNGNSSVFYIRDGNVSINDLTIANGSSYQGGGINSRDSHIYLDDVVVTGNTAFGRGGGVFFSRNTSTITNSKLVDNVATEGGAVQVTSFPSSVSISNSSISGNSALENGGGIALDFSASLNVNNSTFFNNRAGERGGALHISRSQLSLQNSTLSGNSAEIGGGGLYTTFGSTATIQNNTVTDNVGTTAGGLGLIGSTTELFNNVVAGNQGREINAIGATIVSANNLLGDDSKTSQTAFTGFTPDASDLIANIDGDTPIRTNRIIGPLSGNRGDQLTHALVPNSPAINAGANAVCPAEDQRFEARSDGECDIGSVEFDGAMDVATIEVNSAFDDFVGCTLREAAQSFNSQFAFDNECIVNGSIGVNDIITFAPSIHNEAIVLTQPQASVNFTNRNGRSVFIQGPESGTLEIRGTNDRVFFINNGYVSFENLTISGGSSTFGGGIYSRDARIGIHQSTLSGNTVTNSGGAIRAIGSDIWISNSTLSGNEANRGAGVSLFDSELQLENSTVSNNQASASAAIEASDTTDHSSIIILNSTIAANTAELYAGGIGLSLGAKMDFSNSILAGNRALVRAELELRGGQVVGLGNNIWGDSANDTLEAFGVAGNPASNANNELFGKNILGTSDAANLVFGELLTSLRNHGGRTQTHALKTNSVARNGGLPRLCPLADQRDNARNDGACDIGAVEFNQGGDQAEIVVNDPGDTDAGCTLREAVATANASVDLNNGCNIDGYLGIKDVISFAPALAGDSITLSQPAPLYLSQSELELEVRGLGQDQLQINGAGNAAVLYARGTNLTISDITIANGSASNGGGIGASGGALLLDNALLTNNVAEFGGGLSVTAGSLVLRNTQLSANTASTHGGGMVMSLATATFSNSNISGNSAAQRGGGVYAPNSDWQMLDTTVSSNTALLGGGVTASGISVFSVDRSTFANNSATTLGGGLALEMGPDGEIRTSTFSNNTAADGAGMSVSSIYFADNTIDSSFLTVVNSTLSGNTASTQGGGVRIYNGILSFNQITAYGNSALSGGGLAAIDSALNVNNSLFTGNRSDTGAEIYFSAPNVTPTASFNMLGDATNSSSVAFTGLVPDASNLTATNDGTNPTALNQILLPLADNGGATLTHGLLKDSPARDFASLAVCPVRDQINSLRRADDGRCDIGALEFDIGAGFIVIPLVNGKVVVIPN